MSISEIYVGKTAGRLALLVGSIAVLTVYVFGIKWFFGNSIASQAQTIDVANFAASLAPKDPQTHYSYGVILDKSFIPDDQPKSLQEFEAAVIVSPYDFRLWLALGRARERAGDVEGALKALDQAELLSPANSQVLWSYGNILLRQGKTKEGFAEIKKAVDADPAYAGAAANTAWQIFQGNLPAIRNTIGNSNSVNAALAIFLAGNKQYGEAFELWSNLPDSEVKADLRDESESLMATLMGAGLYAPALLIKAKIVKEGDTVFKPGIVTNAGFEQNVKTDKAEIFEWQLDSGPQPNISVDEQVKHSGSRSILLSFKATKLTDFRIIKQTVALSGGKSYGLSFFYKSELDSNSTLKIEVVDATTGLVIGSSPALDKKAAWKNETINFELPPTSQGIQIRFARSGCSSAVCPLNGKIWFDDFKIN